MFGGLFVGVFVNLLFGLGVSFWGIVWLLFPPAGAFSLAVYLTGFSHTCTYVGDEGVARFVCTGTARM